ncbi:MAG: hypothetical protein GXP25_00385 [Planctomycetes bacterium]|nr:hypothetical protein [Planctomycetota bacterium]
MKRYLWMWNVGLALIAVALAGGLIVQRTQAPVLAQSSGEVSDIIAIAGQDRPRDDEPLFLIDTKNQVLMAYEYQIQTNNFALRGVRRFTWDAVDKDVLFAPIGKTKPGPRVKDVMDLIQKEAQR